MAQKNAGGTRVAQAWAIAAASTTHAAACREIVERGIAEDAAEAEALLYEGETDQAYLPPGPVAIPPRRVQ